MVEMKKGDRVLVLDPRLMTQVREWARQCESVVGVGEMDEVRTARKELDDVDNVMFTQGSRDEIPWGNAHFTVIVDTSGLPLTAEMQRVLVEGGRIVEAV